MMRQMTSRTKAGACAIFAFAALALAGCGTHDQAGASGGTMTPAQVEQNAQKQNQPQNQPVKSGAEQGTPPASATNP